METVVRRQRRGTPAASASAWPKSLHYRPNTFQSRPIEWEETVHPDTGMLGLTTKHIHFTGSRKKFRIRHHVHILEMNGDSYRLKRSRENASPQAPEEPEEA